MSYFLIWLFSIIEAVDGLFTTFAIIGTILLALIHFRFFFTAVPDGSLGGYNPEYSEPTSTYNRWKKIAGRWRKLLLPWIIIGFVLSAAMPTKKDVAIIFIGGQVGSFVMGNESVQALPGDMAQYLQLELAGAIEGAKIDIKNLKETGKEVVKSINTEELTEEVDEVKELVKTKAKEKLNAYLED